MAASKIKRGGTVVEKAAAFDSRMRFLLAIG